MTSICKQAPHREGAEERIAKGIGRRVFSQALTGSAALLLVYGCGGGGAGTVTPSGSSCSASGTSISLNHGHALIIPLMDLDSLIAMTYSIRGTSDHDHTVTFEVAQLRQLKAGASVTVDASVQSAHTHVVMLACVP